MEPQDKYLGGDQEAGPAHPTRGVLHTLAQAQKCREVARLPPTQQRFHTLRGESQCPSLQNGSGVRAEPDGTQAQWEEARAQAGSSGRELEGGLQCTKMGLKLGEAFVGQKAYVLRNLVLFLAWEFM